VREFYIWGTQPVMTKNEQIKQRTRELYMSLPQELEARKARTDIRDQVLELNYTFFGFVASHTFVNNSSISYEDRFQSACMHFCEIWWQYLWQGDDTHRGYRQDLSFSVFFKPRIQEMIGRELNTVKYSIRRSLCMEVGKLVGKHWGKVTYEDLFDPRVNLPADKMASLKAIFCTLRPADIEDYMVFIESPKHESSVEYMITDNFDSIEELLVQEMLEIEEKITEDKLKEMAEIYQVDIEILRESLPAAEEILHRRLHESIDMHFDEEYLEE